MHFKINMSKLCGKVKLSGAKNSVLRLLAASLLSDGKIKIQNYPSGLLDARVHVGMIEKLGKSCKIIDEETIAIEENKNLDSVLEWDDRSIRNTLLILGALTTRTGEGAVPLPGGCKLGERKFDLHEILLQARRLVITHGVEFQQDLRAG